ncbi:uncharacterized protein FYW61_009251 [Anableps anableps]
MTGWLTIQFCDSQLLYLPARPPVFARFQKTSFSGFSLSLRPWTFHVDEISSSPCTGTKHPLHTHAIHSQMIQKADCCGFSPLVNIEQTAMDPILLLISVNIKNFSTVDE